MIERTEQIDSQVANRSPEYRIAAEQNHQLFRKLYDLLSEEGQALLLEYEASTSRLSSISECVLYEQAFKDGFQLHDRLSDCF